MAVPITLNQSDQAISLSTKPAEKDAVDGAGLARVMVAAKCCCTFAQTFPTGTHAMWLYCWLDSAGVNPLRDTKVKGCRRHRWGRTCGCAAWTASASASRGAIAPLLAASASAPPPRPTSATRCVRWAHCALSCNSRRCRAPPSW